MISRIKVNQPPKSSFVIPNQTQIGLDNQADADPVMAKTTNMMISWKFEVMPQRCFNLFIFIYNDYKYSNIISKEHIPKGFVYKYFGNKSYSYK